MHKLAETPDNNRTPRRHAALAREVHIAHMKALRIRRKSPPGLRSGVKATKALAKGCSKPAKFRAQVFYDGILKSWIGKPETIHFDKKWAYRKVVAWNGTTDASFRKRRFSAVIGKYRRSPFPSTYQIWRLHGQVDPSGSPPI
jgi:hypothetical protein